MSAQRADEPKCLAEGRARGPSQTHARELGPAQIAKGPHSGPWNGGQPRSSRLCPTRSPSE
eukprot:14534671-Alexandrium_andersonii.AAC.1